MMYDEFHLYIAKEKLASRQLCYQWNKMKKNSQAAELSPFSPFLSSVPAYYLVSFTS